MSAEYTNRLSVELKDHGYNFIGRDDFGDLYAFKSEPEIIDGKLDWFDTNERPLMGDAIETLILDWNLEHDIPDASLVNYEWIQNNFYIRI